MQHRGLGLLVLAGSLCLSACATTTVASTPLHEASTSDATASRVDGSQMASSDVNSEKAKDSSSAEASTTSTSTTTTSTTTSTTTTLPAPTTPPTVPPTVPPTTPPPPAAPATPGRTVAPLDPPLAPEDVQRAQWRLIELGFWLNDETGKYGITTQQAVMAFQKWSHLEIDGKLGPDTAAALSTATSGPYGRSDAGTLIEVDKNLQLLFVIVDGKTQWTLNTSTGSEIPYDEPDKNTPGKRQTGDSVTRTGLFDVYNEKPEGWWEGDLGRIYRPKYFSYGEAIHGSNSIPGFPASHGCVRVSVPAMDWIWAENIMPKGIPVWVHGNIPGKEQPPAAPAG